MADIIDADGILVLDRLKHDVELACPMFQRRYVWRRPQIEQLFDDIGSVIDGEYSKRFLGTVVFDVDRAPAASSAGQYWVIDGQQRLTTLYLFLVALAECGAACGVEGKELAQDTFQQYLVSSSKKSKGRPRIRPTLVDSRQFESIVHQAATAADFPADVTPLRAPGESAGPMTEAYGEILKLIRRRIDNYVTNSSEMIDRQAATLDTISTIRDTILESLEFVEITLGKDHDANEVFDRLNKEGVRLGIIDLVRNHVLKSLQSDPTTANMIYNNHWLTFEGAFDEEVRSKYFFPFVLTVNSQATKASTFRELAKFLDAVEPLHDTPADKVKAMIEALQRHQVSYNAIASGKTRHLSDPLQTAVQRLVDLGAPSSVHPYVMQLLTQTNTSFDADAQRAADCLGVIEAFLVRRAICGIEPTGLHAIFKKLWEAAHDDPQSVRKYIESKTVLYPSDELFEQNIRDGALYHRKICSYVLLEHERRFTGGDVLEQFPSITIDHIWPQSFPDGWTVSFPAEEDKALVHTWANLVPLSSPANSTKGIMGWEAARERLGNETVFATTKHLYDDYPRWDAAAIRARATELVEWALDRWPYAAPRRRGENKK